MPSSPTSSAATAALPTRRSGGRVRSGDDDASRDDGGGASPPSPTRHTSNMSDGGSAGDTTPTSSWVGGGGGPSGMGDACGTNPPGSPPHHHSIPFGSYLSNNASFDYPSYNNSSIHQQQQHNPQSSSSHSHSHHHHGLHHATMKPSFGTTTSAGNSISTQPPAFYEQQSHPHSHNNNNNTPTITSSSPATSSTTATTPLLASAWLQSQLMCGSGVGDEGGGGGDAAYLSSSPHHRPTQQQQHAYSFISTTDGSSSLPNGILCKEIRGTSDDAFPQPNINSNTLRQQQQHQGVLQSPLSPEDSSSSAAAAASMAAVVREEEEEEKEANMKKGCHPQLTSGGDSSSNSSRQHPAVGEVVEVDSSSTRRRGLRRRSRHQSRENTTTTINISPLTTIGNTTTNNHILNDEAVPLPVLNNTNNTTNNTINNNINISPVTTIDNTNHPFIAKTTDIEEDHSSSSGGAFHNPHLHNQQQHRGDRGTTSITSSLLDVRGCIVPRQTQYLQHSHHHQAPKDAVVGVSTSNTTTPTNKAAVLAVSLPVLNDEEVVFGRSSDINTSQHQYQYQQSVPMTTSQPPAVPSTASTTTLTPGASPVCCEMLTFISTTLSPTTVSPPTTNTSTPGRHHNGRSGGDGDHPAGNGGRIAGGFHSIHTSVSGGSDHHNKPLLPSQGCSDVGGGGGSRVVVGGVSRRNSLARSHSFGALSIKCVAPPSVLYAEVRRRRNQHHNSQNLHQTDQQYFEGEEEVSAGSAHTGSVYHTTTTDIDEDDNEVGEDNPFPGGDGRVESYMADRGESSPASRQESPRSLFNISGSHNYMSFGDAGGVGGTTAYDNTNNHRNVVSTISPRFGSSPSSGCYNQHLGGGILYNNNNNTPSATSPQVAATTATTSSSTPPSSSKNKKRQQPSPTTTNGGSSRVLPSIAPLSFSELEQEHDFLTAGISYHHNKNGSSMEEAASRAASGGGVISHSNNIATSLSSAQHYHHSGGGTPTSRQSASYTNINSSSQRRRSRGGGGGMGSSTHAEYGTMVDSQRTSRSHSIASLPGASLVPPMSSTAMDARLRKRASILHLAQSSLNSSNYNSPRRTTTTTTTLDGDGGGGNNNNGVIFRPVPTPGSLHWHAASPPLRAAADGSNLNDVSSSRGGGDGGGGYIRVRRGTAVSPTSATHAAANNTYIGGHYFPSSLGALTPTSTTTSGGLTRFPTREVGGANLQQQQPTIIVGSGQSLPPIPQEVPSLAGSTNVESGSVSATSPNFVAKSTTATGKNGNVQQSNHGRTNSSQFNIGGGWSSVSDLLALTEHDRGVGGDVAMSPSVASVRSGIHSIVRRQRQPSHQSLTHANHHHSDNAVVGGLHHRHHGASSFSGSGSWVRAPTAILQTSPRSSSAATSNSKMLNVASVAGILPPMAPRSCSSQHPSASISPRGGAIIIDATTAASPPSSTTHPVYGALPVYRHQGGGLITVLDNNNNDVSIGGGGNISALDIDIAFPSTTSPSTSVHPFASGGAVSPTAAARRRFNGNHNISSSSNFPSPFTMGVAATNTIMASPNSGGGGGGGSRLWGSISSMGHNANNNNNKRVSPQSVVPPLSASIISLGKSGNGGGGGGAARSPSAAAIGSTKHRNWISSDSHTATMNGLNSPSFNSKLEIVVSTAAAAAERLRIATTSHTASPPAAVLASSTSLASSYTAKVGGGGVGGAMVTSTYSSSPSSTLLPPHPNNTTLFRSSSNAAHSPPNTSCFTSVLGRHVSQSNADPTTTSTNSPTLMLLSEKLRAAQWGGSSGGGGVTRSSSAPQNNFDDKTNSMSGVEGVGASGGGKYSRSQNTNKSVVASAALVLAGSLSVNPHSSMSSKSLYATQQSATAAAATLHTSTTSNTNATATTRASQAPTSKGALVASVLHKLQRRPSLMLSLFLQDSYSTIHYTNFFGPRQNQQQNQQSSTRSPPKQQQQHQSHQHGFTPPSTTNQQHHQQRYQEFNSQETTGIDSISMREIVGDSLRDGGPNNVSWHPTTASTSNNNIQQQQQVEVPDAVLDSNSQSLFHLPGTSSEQAFHDHIIIGGVAAGGESTKAEGRRSGSPSSTSTITVNSTTVVNTTHNHNNTGTVSSAGANNGCSITHSEDVVELVMPSIGMGAGYVQTCRLPHHHQHIVNDTGAFESSSSPSTDNTHVAGNHNNTAPTTSTTAITRYVFNDAPPAFNWDDALAHSLTDDRPAVQQQQQPRFTSITKPVTTTINSSSPDLAPCAAVVTPSSTSAGRRHRETSVVTILANPGDNDVNEMGAAYHHHHNHYNTNSGTVAEDDDNDDVNEMGATKYDDNYNDNAAHQPSTRNYEEDEDEDNDVFDGADEQLMDSRFVVSGRVLTHPSNPLYKVEHSDGIVRCVDNENGDLVICVGMVLLGWLEVVRELGAGSFGQVVLCKDLRTVLNCGFYYDLDQEQTDHAYYQTTEEYLDVEVREGSLVAVKVISSDAAMEQQSYLEAQILQDLSLAAEMEEASALQSQHDVFAENGDEQHSAPTTTSNNPPRRKELRGQYICKVLANGGTFGHHCIAMELYPTNLYEYMLSRDLRGLPLAEIRAITRHTLLALSLTHETGIVHCDVKPENIMIQPLLEGGCGNGTSSSRRPSSGSVVVAEDAAFNAFDAEAEDDGGAATATTVASPIHHVDPTTSTLTVEENDTTHRRTKSTTTMMMTPDPIKAILIDFSSSTREGGDLYDYIQSRYYRAPEVIVGVRYGGPMDVWSVGCVMAEMLLGRPLLPGGNNYQQLFLIEQMFGPLPDEMLVRGRLTHTYYNNTNPAITTTTSTSSQQHEEGEEDISYSKPPPPQQPDTPAYGSKHNNNGSSGGGGKSAVSWLDGSALTEDESSSANHNHHHHAGGVTSSLSPLASHSHRTNNTTTMSAVSMSTLLTPSLRDPLSATGSVRDNNMYPILPLMMGGGGDEGGGGGTCEHFGDDLEQTTTTTTGTTINTACASPTNHHINTATSSNGDNSPTRHQRNNIISGSSPTSSIYSLKTGDQYDEEQRGIKKNGDGGEEEDEGDNEATCTSPYIPPPPPVQYLNYTTLADNIIHAEWTPGELEMPEGERTRNRKLLSDLLCQMLIPDPSRRISVDQALEHPFFRT